MAHTLLLNADAQPVSYLPLSIIKWKEAITYLWLDKVTVLEWYDDWMVHSASWETRVPAVIMLKEMEYNDDLSNSSIRVSLGPDTKKSDIEAFIFSWKQLYSRHIRTGNLHK